MSSPIQALGPVVPVSRTANARKRVLSDSEDTEERDLKRVRPQDASGDQNKRQDSKEKKKRRKKKRKVSVVQTADSSDADSPTIASKPTLPPMRSRSVTSIGRDGAIVTTPTKMTHEDTRQPSAGPSSVPGGSPKSPSQVRERGTPTPTTSESVDKGKGRATPEAVAQDNSQELSDLQKQLSDKTNLISQHQNLVSSFEQSLSCQICLDLMHRPYALSPCGHSACYQCLVNWFKAPPPDVPADELRPVTLRKKTCPHCRSIITERPVEIWTIKDMVATLVKSGLATGFHSSAAEQPEAGANDDPWTGIFRPPPGVFPPYVAHQLMGLRDDEDGGIYRCIDCNHEIWDGVCSNCGRDYPGHASDYDDEDDEDGDDIPFWGEAAPHGGDVHELFHQLFQAAAHPQYADPLDDLPVLHDWDGGGDTEIESDDEDFNPETHARQRAARRTAARLRGDSVSDSEEDDEAGYESSFIDDGDGDVAAPPAGGSRAGLRGRAVNLDEDDVIVLSDGESQHDHEDAHHDENDNDSSIDRTGLWHAPAVFGRGVAIISDDEDHVEEGGSDRSFGGDDDDEGNLADEVAAREYEMYGDDGSVPRHGGRGYDSHDSEEEELY